MTEAVDMERFRASLERYVQSLFVGESKVLVHGEGVLGARVMLIGEAPGAQEALQGRPFVGKAGKNLDAFLEGAGLSRRELFISNVVKFRPTRVSAAGRTVNRPPTQEEIELFLPWLKKEIELVHPECLVTLGNVPLKALLGRGYSIGEAHGRFHEAEGRRLFAMYHPASVIYNPRLNEVYRADLETLARWLSEEKHTNFTKN